MKNQLIIVMALLFGTFSFAQKSELRDADKAIGSGNYADAKSALAIAEPMIAGADEKTQAKYYFLKGQALFANGTGSNADIDKAIENFEKVKVIEKQSGKEKYSSEIDDLKLEMINGILSKANTALQSEEYIKSSSGFEQAYRMSSKDTLYLYYAASTAVTAQDYKTSLKLYEELRDLGYQGVAMEYYATNKESGEEEAFDNKNLRDMSVRSGSHIAAKDKKTESKKAEIVKNIALIHLSNGDDVKALGAMEDARAANPDDLGLLISEANVQLKMGNKKRFKELMEEATTKDPNNAELQYNLGVIAAEAGEKEAAQKYYERAIELEPSYSDAYTNLSVLMLSGEAELVEEMNSLGTSAKDNKRYDELRDQRVQLYKSAIPYLETALKLKPNNIEAAKTLMNIYSITSDTDKFKTMKAQVESMEAGN
ncbi:tetratricopeptide repeat protein [Subsaximicrobium wynnwilliamsii]|uniref:Tetratricopeptide repeat protein n=1 Tax=Subsaximicrobium wynnwilliamsii TaxID=291179 RepID=A0A5C6ZMI4_9FLAO|nr:tetratricopeptide repeat protein [Subsaximicrobium wynnwilliamsii]TXD85233.1 tetratricopeptide repeat protein [Subsaximicrobium wynnwilliamsii]TXD91276.1 tetratricopeptide repeat protein [Subsaximicrobium wynnwilliamsii]TXE04669.1 tetratricopeptide repeat protein [Subsaximicrobium wynnwilliamsii]